MTEWHIPPEIYIPADLLDFTGDPFLARLLVQRGLTTVPQARAFLEPTAYRPAPATDLPDMPPAVQRLTTAIQRQELICVWGDFDVDGQTSTTLLVSSLRQLGGRVTYYIPDRLTESHGIRLPALHRILGQGIDLLLTCDTGIAEHEAIQTAQTAGVEVIVTDHHDLADTLPPAVATINPKRLPAHHPLRELPGVGVAYKLAEALIEVANPAKADTLTTSLLDLVALGIVADVATQTGDTRYLLQQGLPVLSQTQRLGLQALIENSRLRTDRLTEEHIGFWIGPRLNALGRLGNANLAVELLTTTDPSRANILATQIEGLNDQRKLLVEQVTAEALEQIAQTPSLADYNGLVLAAPGWHPGVIGIAASRLVDQFGKPTILIALTGEGRERVGRGSARSVAGCDIHQAIKSQANLLHHFGGHPMAAGLSMPAENLIPFRQGLSDALAGCHQAADRAFYVDAFVPLREVSSTLLTTIQRLAPFGPGNPPVMLACREVEVVQQTIFGKWNDHKRVVIADQAGDKQELIWWGGANEPSPAGQFDVAFTLSPDDFHGEGAVQLEWQTFRQVEEVATIVTKPTLVDWQTVDKPVNLIRQHNLAMIWGEGIRLPDVSLRSREQLQPSNHLVIWTVPPHEQIYRQALATVQPQQIFLVGQPTSSDTLPAFMQLLMGLLKYAGQHKEGLFHVKQLAAAMGHTEATIRLGLDWLIAQGKVIIEPTTESTIESSNHLAQSPWQLKIAQQPPDKSRAAIVELQLKAALAETAAYRKFFRTTFASQS